MMSMQKVVAILLIALYAVIASAQAGGASQATDTGTIQGIVTRVGSAEALPEVQIVVFGRGSTPNLTEDESGSRNLY